MVLEDKSVGVGRCKGTGWEVYHEAGYGPWFGYDFAIFDKSHQNNHSWVHANTRPELSRPGKSNFQASESRYSSSSEFIFIPSNNFFDSQSIYFLIKLLGMAEEF